MTLTPDEFHALAAGQVLYLPGGGALLIVSAGLASGVYWVLAPGFDFHVLAVHGMTLSREGDQLTWTNGKGDFFVIAPLAGCEEINTGDAQRLIAQAREEYAAPEAAAWLRDSIRDAGQCGPLETTLGK